MLRTKYRFLIFLAVFIAFYVCLPIPYAPVNRIAVELDINPKDPLLFETNHVARFHYNNGTTDLTMIITVTEVDGMSNWANVSIQVGDITVWVQPTLDGLIRDRYTIFWLHIGNIQQQFNFGAEPGTIYNVTDPVGLIGPQNANYTAVVDRKTVLWALDAPLHGAQFSFIVTFYSTTNNEVAGVAMYDSTCGLLFTLNGGSPYVDVKLLETSYPISRNRLTVIPWAIGIFIALPIVAYILLKKRWNLQNETINEVVLLLGAGGAAFGIDVYYDVWFYALLGFEGSLLLHLGATVGLGILCLYKKYNLKCITPAILELAFVISMVVFVGDDYVPHLTAFWGLITSWLIMLYMSKHSPPIKPTTKSAKIISEFV
ncbi:MAG: hypothetical protein LUQ65_07700 [Candidatus Helarchaeota archaeon]|nr:hypothetical protein [Candidatus Helarchaeota archaeon]